MKPDLSLGAQFSIMTLGFILLGFVIPWVGYGINASFGIAACYFTPSSKECLEYRASICPGAASVCIAKERL